MVYSEFIEILAKKFPNIGKSDIEISVKLIIDYMENTLIENGRIEIRGFGSFQTKYMPSRKARNPKTGEQIMTKPRSKVSFKAGKHFNDILNK
jgi:integration host factor subunit beta